MEWDDKLQTIIDYVENHLQREEELIDPNEVAKIAGCSFGFFQKVFSYMRGISFAEYVRFRKLTLAGYDLKSTNARVLDISFKYGYDSPTSFTKAFQQFHGISPKEARDKEIELRVVPKMKLTDQQRYTWRLEKKPTFRLVGKTYKLDTSGETLPEEILQCWSKYQRDGTFSTLISMDTGNPKGMFGYLDESGYSIRVISDMDLPEGFSEYIVPEATWAVFDCIGPVPEAIQKGWKYLLEEWLIAYPFAHARCVDLEWYSSGNSYDKSYLTQIWIPIIEEGGDTYGRNI